MLKKLTALGLTIFMMLSITACGNGSNQDSTSTDETATQPATEEMKEYEPGRSDKLVNEQGLADNISDGAILHCWCWSFNTIKENMKKYDVHSHILPYIDDGASDIDISLLLLEELEKQGVTNLALTPHFYTQYYDVEQRLTEFLKERDYHFEQLKKIYKGNITLTIGAAVRLWENILVIDNLQDL